MGQAMRYRLLRANRDLILYYTPNPVKRRSEMFKRRAGQIAVALKVDVYVFLTFIQGGPKKNTHVPFWL